MYLEFDKKNDMTIYLSPSYLTMENILQKLNIIMKNDYISLTFVIFFTKGEILCKKINE